MVLHVDPTIILLVLLAFIAGGAVAYSIVTRRENRILKSRVQELMLHLKRYERLLESIKESEDQKEKQVNIDTKILELYGKGYSLRKIAKEVGLSHTTVARRLKRLLSESEIQAPIGNIRKRELAALEA